MEILIKSWLSDSYRVASMERRMMDKKLEIADYVKLVYPPGDQPEKTQLNIRVRQQLRQRFNDLVRQYGFRSQEQALAFLLEWHDVKLRPEKPHRKMERRIAEG